MNITLDKNKILSKTYGKQILNFINIIISNFPIYSMEEFINKVNNLKIESTPSSLKDIVLKISNDHPICYYPSENKIFIIKDNIDDDTIYHELFHMLSSFNDNNIVYSGFKQSNKNNKTFIGKGINEGYTQFLKERYFGFNQREQYFYLVEKHIVKHIEIIIGQRKMEELYSEANLPRLVNELEKFDHKKNIEELIEAIDYLSDNAKKCDKNNINNVNVKLNMVLKDLLDIYVKKQVLLLNKGILNNEILKNNIENYITSLAKELVYKDRKYNALSYEDVEEILKLNNLSVSNKTR